MYNCRHRYRYREESIKFSYDYFAQIKNAKKHRVIKLKQYFDVLRKKMLSGVVIQRAEEDDLSGVRGRYCGVDWPSHPATAITGDKSPWRPDGGHSN